MTSFQRVLAFFKYIFNVCFRWILVLFHSRITCKQFGIFLIVSLARVFNLLWWSFYSRNTVLDLFRVVCNLHKTDTSIVSLKLKHSNERETPPRQASPASIPTLSLHFQIHSNYRTTLLIKSASVRLLFQNFCTFRLYSQLFCCKFTSSTPFWHLRNPSRGNP